MHPAALSRRFMDRVDHSGWWMFVGTLLVVALWGLLIWLVVAAFRRSTGPAATTPDLPPHTPPTGGASSASDSPIDGAVRILAERLARGEIDPDEYRLRLDTLRTTSVGPEVSDDGT